MFSKIICTSQASHIGKKLEKRGINIIRPSKNRDGRNYFPDGETYVALKGIKKSEKRCVVLHSGSPKPDKGLAELRMVLEILNNLKVKSIELFFLYFPYGMQDGIFDRGESNVAESLIKEFTHYYGVKKIYVIDAHFYKKSWTRNYPIANIGVFDLLISKARQDFPDILFISPDRGAIKRNGIRGMEKKRINSYEVEMKRKNSFKKLIKGKVIGVVDDLLETGGTLDRFYDECKTLGAKEAVALITHGVLKRGIDRIRKKYANLYMTNTINQKKSNVNIAEVVIEMIKIKP